MKKTHLPIEEQNYDPMIPYMAPYMEEAKFQLQEEQELGDISFTNILQSLISMAKYTGLTWVWHISSKKMDYQLDSH